MLPHAHTHARTYKYKHTRTHTDPTIEKNTPSTTTTTTATASTTRVVYDDNDYYDGAATKGEQRNDRVTNGGWRVAAVRVVACRWARRMRVPSRAVRFDQSGAAPRRLAHQ